MSNSFEHLGLGWLPDYPDYRDYDVSYDVLPDKLKVLNQKFTVKGTIEELGGLSLPKVGLPTKVDDLIEDFPEVEDQSSLGSCTANAGVGLVEYFEKRAFGKHIDASRLFIYKATRNLMKVTGDTGAYIRITMGAMVLFGMPPEEYWPYVITEFDNEPPAFCYSFAQNYQALMYYRLDPPRITRDQLLERIKLLIYYRLPSMFGFTVFNSISQAHDDGKIPYPYRGDRAVGGHAVIAMGYDDEMEIKHTASGSPKTKGALQIRNSWGSGWGDNGYGWLPYDYVTESLARDWWSLTKSEWIETGKFGVGG